MVKKKLVFVNDAEEDGKQTLDKADEDPSTEEGTALVPPKKIKVNADREQVVEYGYACSSPSASDFIVMPTVKPSVRRNASSSKIFSDEDEIALLKGLALFWANGRNNKWTEFHQFVKNDLSNQFSKIQVSEKVRHFKMKFESNSEKARANGGRLDFSDSHEAIVFRLCKALWGDEKGDAEDEEASKTQRKRKEADEGLNKKKKERKRGYVGGEKSKKLEKEKQVDEEEKEKQVDEEHQENNVPEKKKQVDEDNKENDSAEKGKKQVMKISQEDFQSAFPLLYASFDTFKYANIVKEKCTLIPPEKAQEVEEKCRELKAEALLLEIKKMELIKSDLLDHLQKI